MSLLPKPNSNAEAAINALPARVRPYIVTLRALIFETAAKIEAVGPVEECLKWGQISYVTNETRSGTTIRLDESADFGGDYALFVNCQTSLVSEWRTLYPHLLFGKNRSLHLRIDQPLDAEIVGHCIGMALTYHLRKKAR